MVWLSLCTCFINSKTVVSYIDYRNIDWFLALGMMHHHINDNEGASLRAKFMFRRTVEKKKGKRLIYY